MLLHSFRLALLLIGILTLQETFATSFSDSSYPDYVDNILGTRDSQNLNPQTGFFDFSESRLNIYGERSSVFYHLKPHVSKLKVRVDHSCFEIKCSPGKYILIQRSAHSASLDAPNDDCLHSSVSALASNDHFTARSFTYSQKRPSIEDVRPGDLLRGDAKCLDGTAGSFRITSIFTLSDVSFGSSKRIYEVNMQPAAIEDIVSEGFYEFHTENLLTVNHIRRPHARAAETAKNQFNRKLVDLSWNFDEEEGGAAKTINLWNRSTSENTKASVDCVKCYARFTAAATIKFEISVRPAFALPPWTVTTKLMVEISLNVIANVDIKFSFNYEYEWEYSKKLLTITPMINQNLASFKVLGFNNILKATYGIDISVGVKFEAKAEFAVTVGADIQCNFKFGVYHNYKPSSEGDGCSHKFHKPEGNFVTGSVELVPYVLFEPFVEAGLGTLLYGKAKCIIQPQLVLSATFNAPEEEEEGQRRLLEEEEKDPGLLDKIKFGIDLKIPISFSAVVGYDINIKVHTFKDEKKLGPYKLHEFAFKLLSSHYREPLTQIRATSSDDASVHGQRDIKVRSPSDSQSMQSVTCMCASKNTTIPWQVASSKATLSSSTTTWQVVNGTLIDTCDYTEENVDAISMIFIAPVTGHYDVGATLSSLAPESESSSWGVYARVGPGCCGDFVFCDWISADWPTFDHGIFLHANSTLSLVWTSSSHRSEAAITTTISLSNEPVVYVDIEYGSDFNDGSYLHPVKQLEKGFAILATKITPTVLNATIMVYPTFYSGEVMSMSSPSGFVIPNILKTVHLTISSAIHKKASEIFEAWKHQEYCNYLITECVSEDSFFGSVWGTSFDTEIKSTMDGSRAFTLDGFKSITFDGIWFENFKSYVDGAVVFAMNSAVTIKNCYFINNKALKLGRGSAIFGVNSNISIEHSVFSNHLSKGNGGTIHASRNSNVDILGSIFEGSLSDGQGGIVYFDASEGSALNVVASKFWLASSVAGAGIYLLGGRNNEIRNSIFASDFSGLSASEKGGSILLMNSNLKMELSSMSNTFAVSGASFESYSSDVMLAGTTFNATGAPQLALELSSSFTDSSSSFSYGGQFCPLSHCDPSRLRNGQCDPICNISLCQFDGGDCLCDISICPPNVRGNGICDIGCASSGCQYDLGDCCDVSLCTFSMRNNSRCDPLCNNKACGFDDGDCSNNSNVSSNVSSRSSPSDSETSSMTDSLFEFRNSQTISVLRLSESPVVLSLQQFSQTVIKQSDGRRGDGLSLQTHSYQDSNIPASIFCSASSAKIVSTVIEPGKSGSGVESASCTGLASCSSCGICGLCTAAGCDTSVYDSYCVMRGKNWKCASAVPTAANNFSLAACVDTSRAIAASGSESKQDQVLSPGATAGVTIAAIVIVASAVLVAVHVIKRRNQARSSPNNMTVPQRAASQTTAEIATSNFSPSFVSPGQLRSPSSEIEIADTVIELDIVSSGLRRDQDIALASDSISPVLAAMQVSVPQSPPRERSKSRARATDALTSTYNSEIPAQARSSLGAGQFTVPQSPPRERSKSRARATDALTSTYNSEIPAQARSSLGAGQFTVPQSPPRERSKSRARATAALSSSSAIDIPAPAAGSRSSDSTTAFTASAQRPLRILTGSVRR